MKENSTYAGMSFEDVTKEFSDNVTRICISATGNYEDAFRMGVATGSASAFSENLATKREISEVLKRVEVTCKR